MIALPSTLPAIPHATTNEKLIVGQLVSDLLAGGCMLTVYDGEASTVTLSNDHRGDLRRAVQHRRRHADRQQGRRPAWRRLAGVGQRR
jgi:hypothetical protein